MKKLSTAIITLLISVPALGFIPAQKTPVYVSTDAIYVHDKSKQLWHTKTDCLFDIKTNSDVRVKPIDRKVRINKRLIVSVDGNKQVCRILEIAKV